MIVRDNRPGHPPDGTVRADRRPRDPSGRRGAGFGLRLVRPDRRDEAPRHGRIGWIRQWIESVNAMRGKLSQMFVYRRAWHDG